MSRNIFKASNVNFDDNKYVVAANTAKDEIVTEEADETQATPIEMPTVSAKREAERIIKTAEVNAASLLVDIREQCVKIKEETIINSTREGYEAGYQKGEAESERLIEEAEEIRKQAIIDRQEIIDGIEGEIVAFIETAVKKILHDTAEINPQVILGLIRLGLSDTTLMGDINIHVSPEDYDFVMENKDTIVAKSGSNVKLEIINDMSLSPGDCIIETPFGNIDTSIDTQLSALVWNLYYIFDHEK